MLFVFFWGSIFRFMRWARSFVSPPCRWFTNHISQLTKLIEHETLCLKRECGRQL